MSRKYNQFFRTRQEVDRIMRDPRFIASIFRPRPRWMPKFLWRILVSVVVYK